MSFLNNTVKLTKTKKYENSNQVEPDKLELDFTSRNYAKEAFDVLIAKPASKCFLKFMRITSFVLTGGSLGIIMSLLAVFVLMQFGSIDNKLLSLFLSNHINTVFPDADFSMKSATISWNAEKHSPEILLKKVRLDDIVVPSVSIFPNFSEIFKQRRFVVDSVHIISPKIALRFSDDFKSAYFDPNFERNNYNKVLNEPLSLLQNFKGILNGCGDVKVINADVAVEENGTVWNLSHAYCHYFVGDKLPHVLSFKTKLPDQNYMSGFNIARTTLNGTDRYVVNVTSCNPSHLKEALQKRNSPVNNPIVNAVLDNNLPVSGVIHFSFKDGRIIEGDFDLNGEDGSIKIPTQSSTSINLGKAIDTGNITGTFSENGIKIDSLRVNYEDAGIHLTGIEVPMVEYKLLDIANINGTLALHNVSIEEMATILPQNFSKSVMPVFKNYLSGFKLGLFQVDLRGTVSFARRNFEEPLKVGTGVFTISDAKIPLGTQVIRDVEASGAIVEDGFDIKLLGAKLNDSVINHGNFFISKKDNSWIGTINVDVNADEIKRYASDISKKLGTLHVDKLRIADFANVDMKLVKIDGDTLDEKGLPFRIVEGSGIFKSEDNTKGLKFSWNEKELTLAGDANEGDNAVTINLDENFEANEGSAEFHFKSGSDFLAGLLPGISKLCKGDYSVDLNMGWKGDTTQYDLSLNLKNSVLTLPVLGDMKLKNSDGILKMKALVKDNVADVYDIVLDTVNNRIEGGITIGLDGYLYKCSFSDFSVNGNVAKINIIRNNKNKIAVSIIGDKFSYETLKGILGALPDDKVISCYLNLNEMMMSSDCIVKNPQGSFDIRNGKLIKGACYGVIGQDTTLALSSQPSTNTNDSIVSLSVSNAGEFLKYCKIINGISGGKLNIVVKSSILSNKSLSGAFEMSDFIVKNDLLTRLISFSSTSGLSNPDTYTAGFNTCLGSFVFVNDIIKIENGKIVGPTVGISYEGSYNRLEDRLEISGLSLLVSSILNSQHKRGAYAAPYTVRGSFGRPVLSVKPLSFVTNSAISETFGNLLPTIPTTVSEVVAPIPPKVTDPFARKAFDTAVSEQQNEGHFAESQVASATSEQKFGVKINRGSAK